MARDFTPNDRLDNESFTITEPFTMCGWMATAIDVQSVVISVADKDDADQQHRLHYAENDFCTASSYDGTLYEANTSTTHTDTNWHHYCGVYAASNARAAYLDGGGKGINSDDTTITDIDRVTIGVTADSTPVQWADGQIAECAIWNIALTDAEVLILAAGFSPLFVRPQNLVCYYPLIRGLNDRVGGLNLTDTGGTLVFPHPPIIYPAVPMIVTAPVAVGETIELDVLSAIGSAPNTSLALGAVQLAMDVLSAIGSAPNATLSLGEVQLALNAISASGSVPSLTLSLGEVQILLDALTASGSAENITLSLATIIILSALSAATSAESITLSLGEIQILLDALSGDTSAPGITLLPGQVSIVLEALSAASQAQNLSVSLALLIALNALSASATAQSMTLSPGEATVILTALEAVLSAPDIRLATVATAALERLISVLAENRIITVASENRIVTVPAEDRTKTI